MNQQFALEFPFASAEYLAMPPRFRSPSTALSTRTVYDHLPSFSAEDSEAIAAAFELDGCVLLRRILKQDEITEARRKIDELKPIYWDFTGTTDHYKNVFNRDPFWLGYLDRYGVIDLVESVLGSNCHIIGQTCWRSHPGHQGVGLHLDYLAIELPPDLAMIVRVPAFLCTAHFYLSPQPIELCPTWVIPGSHRAGRRPASDESNWMGRESLPVLCDAGDVLFFRSDLWHRGSDNITADQTRYLVQVHYGRREMAQHFAPYLDWKFRDDVIAAATPRQRRLLGDHEPAAYD